MKLFWTLIILIINSLICFSQSNNLFIDFSKRNQIKDALLQQLSTERLPNENEYYYFTNDSEFYLFDFSKLDSISIDKQFKTIRFYIDDSKLSKPVDNKMEFPVIVLYTTTNKFYDKKKKNYQPITSGGESRAVFEYNSISNSYSFCTWTTWD